MKQFITLLILMLVAWSSSAQFDNSKGSIQILEGKNQKTESPYIKGENALSFVATPFQADKDFKPNVKAASSPNLSKDHSKVRKLREEATVLKRNGIYVDGADQHAGDRGVQFSVTQGFYSDLNNGCPNDNTIAVSKGGKIISMMNTMVGIYNRNGSYVNSYQLDDFFRNNVTSTCDPKVEYDPVADRFFMFVQSCAEPFDNVAMGFSKTNDPNGGWNIYLFKSDALGTGSMSDYPKVAITKDEVFVSLRLFGLSSGTYEQTIVYQMDKRDGYSGESLTYMIWKNLPFSTTPVRSGSGQYGPGAYLLHTNSAGGNSVVLMDITQNLDNNPTLLSSEITVPQYGVSSSVAQQGSNNPLDGGETRMQDAYYQNGIIHYVHSTATENWGTVRYHRLNASTLDGNVYSEIQYAGTLDYTYPSISPFTLDTKNQTSIVHFQASGPNSLPEMRGKIFNHDFTFEASQDIHKGDGSMEYCYNQERGVARWGDYTEVALDYSKTTPTVWVSGSVSNWSSPVWNTYIAELTANGIPTSTDELEDTKVKLFPNPSAERAFVYIDTDKTREVDFLLFDGAGRKVSHMMRALIKNGHNEFSFDVSSLAEGIYFLKIIDQNQNLLKNEKVVVYH